MARNKHPEMTVKRILDVSLKLFMEKGYEQTTIQNIIDELGDLSKGAIYHHFKSKEEIIEVIAEEFSKAILEEIQALKKHTNMTGLAKLQQILRFNLQDSNQQVLIAMAPNLLKNPKFLALQLHSGDKEVAPIMQGFIEEGIVDGSITAQHPKQLSQVLILLSNIWINPMVFACTSEELYEKYIFFKDMTELLGIPIFDEEVFRGLDNYRKLLH